MSIVNPFFAEPFEHAIIPEKFQELKNKKILVNGAARFIGGALFRRLAAYGCDVTGTVLYPHEAEAFRRNGFKAEVLDLASDEPFLEGKDLVFHVAAIFRDMEHGEALYNLQLTVWLPLCQLMHVSAVGPGCVKTFVPIFSLRS